MQPTERERTMIQQIRASEYQTSPDGSDPVWSWAVVEECAEISDGKMAWAGVISSLVRKGYAVTQGKGENATVQLTPAGLAACATER